MSERICSARRWLALAIVFPLLLCGCRSLVQSETHPALARRNEPITSLAVAPVVFPVARSGQGEDADTALRDKAGLVARHLAEAFAARGIEVVTVDDLVRAAGSDSPELAATPRRWADLAKREFGVDAVLITTLRRFVEREGQAAGTLRPASVAFDVAIHAADGGALLWSSVFDETQRSLSENVLVAGQYPGGGTRWLTASELARFGAAQTAEQAPVRAAAGGSSGVGAQP
ncbi:MAG: hypothetical protein HKP27_01745 [Myxococcales bacterium]|nr:hypothetical protein [Myxococcales bacterium]